jgi:hypothetical protein
MENYNSHDTTYALWGLRGMVKIKKAARIFCVIGGAV